MTKRRVLIFIAHCKKQRTMRFQFFNLPMCQNITNFDINKLTALIWPLKVIRKDLFMKNFPENTGKTAVFKY